jgi:hypothetical protein
MSRSLRPGRAAGGETGSQANDALLYGAPVSSVRAAAGWLAVGLRAERACLADVRYLLGFLPSNNLEPPPVEPAADDPERPCPMATHTPTTSTAFTTSSSPPRRSSATPAAAPPTEPRPSIHQGRKARWYTYQVPTSKAQELENCR